MLKILKFILPHVLRGTRGLLRLAGSTHRSALGASLALADAEEVAAFKASCAAREASAAANEAKRSADQVAQKAERHTDAVYAGVLSELDQLGL